MKDHWSAKSYPFVTLSISILALVVFYEPDISALSFYNRDLILNGELWRLVTAPIAHFSKSHLFWNVSVFTVFGCYLETSHKSAFSIICGLTTLLTGFVYLIFAQKLHVYGGLSGLATGIVFYTGLYMFFQKGSKLWILLIILIMIKLIIETAFGEMIFVSTEKIVFVVLPSSHFLGCLCASSFWLFQQYYCRSRKGKVFQQGLS